MSWAADNPEQRGEPTSSRRFIVTAFSLVAVGALASTLFAVGQTRRLESNARTVVEEMLGA